MTLLVHKYGGTSVGSLKHIEQVAEHISSCINTNSKIVVIISAMGAQTEELATMARTLNPSPPERELDMLLTAGERISMALLSIALHGRKINSQSLTGSQCGILTDNVHGNARISTILGDRIRTGLQRHQVVIAAGFQGVNPETKEVTTLGRGGSDLTALALATTLKSDCCRLFKDVQGVCTADPRLVDHSFVVPRINWNTMSELSWAGAQVLHPRAADLAARHRVPFEIRSSMDFGSSGTVVDGGSSMEGPSIVTIAHRSAMARLIFAVENFELGQTALIGANQWLWERGEAPLGLQSDGSRVAIFVKEVLSGDYENTFRSLYCDANQADPATVSMQASYDLSVLSIIGTGFLQAPELVAQVQQVVGNRSSFLALQSSTIIIAVPQSEARSVMHELHTRLESHFVTDN